MTLLVSHTYTKTALRATETQFKSPAANSSTGKELLDDFTYNDAFCLLFQGDSLQLSLEVTQIQAPDIYYLNSTLSEGKNHV